MKFLYCYIYFSLIAQQQWVGARTTETVVDWICKDIHSNTATEPAASDSSHSLSDGRDVNGDNEQDLYSFVEKSGTNAVLSQSMCVVNLSVHSIIIFTVDW